MKKKLSKKRFVIDAMTNDEIEALNTEIKRAQHRQRNHEKECRVERIGKIGGCNTVLLVKRDKDINLERYRQIVESSVYKPMHADYCKEVKSAVNPKLRGTNMLNDF